MNKKPICRLGLALLAAAFLWQAWGPPLCRAQAKYDYINISDPFLRKIPVAVPEFRSMTEPETEAKASARAADILTDGLTFSGYFEIIDRGAYLEDLQEKGIKGQDLNFDNWSDIGAELLITGGLWRYGDAVRLELRLFDTIKGELLFGKRYKGRIADMRRMIHRFCSEMVERFTGRTGLFDSRIVFIRKHGGDSSITVCDFDGHNPEQIVSSKAITLFPAWSPDGRRIAYTSYARGKPEIFVKELGAGGSPRISYDGVNITPTWVPGTGGKMAATLSVSGDEEIYLLTDSGKIDKRLTDSWGIDVSPSFSPDGSEMAFVSKRSGSPQVYIQELGSGDVRRLTYEGSYNTEPAWSPEGDRIAYSSMENGRADICVIGVDGGSRQQLTRDSGSNESPAWSPDGSLIVFSSTRSGKAKLYVMTASGTDQRPLLDMPGEQVLPDWSPAAAAE
ncbi:MAG TPA: Tol-Pal system beta propeller repeat protein TolB [Desulfosalsimonadaceae bacterium]|nr:Tol-Pal system beta propeller repeat protein TolB [Desulfosalsimonadaceae bacterium]